MANGAWYGMTMEGGSYEWNILGWWLLGSRREGSWIGAGSDWSITLRSVFSSTPEWLAWRFVEMGGLRRAGGNDKVGMSVEMSLLHAFSASVVSLLEGSSA
nr:hypothetical protein L204_03762 [Cryptococcus depauperatus CBS 7855]